MSYQVWLVQTDFFKGLTIKYPHKVRKGNSDGTWYEADILAIKITQAPKATHTEDEPEKRHWNGYTTYLERDSY